METCRRSKPNTSFPRLRCRSNKSDQDAHQLISLSAQGARHDVGSMRGEGENDGRENRDRLQSDRLRLRRRCIDMERPIQGSTWKLADARSRTRHFLGSDADRTKVIKTLINSFRYPRKGPGMMWEACAEKVKTMGGKIEIGCKVTACAYDDVASTWSVQFKDRHGNLQTLEAEHVISSAPMQIEQK